MNTGRRGKRPTPADAALIALVGSNRNFEGDNPCRECDGTGWVLYRSETVDGKFEIAYRLCPQGHAPRYSMGYENGRLCPRPATVRQGQGYYCEEHSVVEKGLARAATPRDPAHRKVKRLWTSGSLTHRPGTKPERITTTR